jgi:type 1 fimbria pilin
MKKPFFKLVMVTTLSLFSVGAFAAGNNGQVTFSGEVVDAPCNLAPAQDGTDIKVPFGQLSMSQLNAGLTTPESFQIHLENCDLTGKTATIMFTSPNQISGKNLLGPHGTSTGLGIGISGITFGTAAPLPGLKEKGDNTLTYTAVAQRADAGTDVAPGTFEAITNFQISYQ